MNVYHRRQDRREHALGWKVARIEKVGEYLFAPVIGWGGFALRS